MENIFKIKREERWPSFLALLYVILWNSLVIYKYADKFFALNDNYRRLFMQFHISGFDPISYMVISNWDTSYNIYRHPLLAFFMFIPNQLNQVLMALTGTNLATVIMGLILTFCAFYSFIFLVRIFHNVIGTSLTDSWLLGALTFSFGYVIVGISVPDHFCLSMFMLILTLYVSGMRLNTKRPFTTWQTIMFFFPYRRHLTKQWHKGLSFQLVCKRQAFLAATQFSFRHNHSLGIDMAWSETRMATLRKA